MHKRKLIIIIIMIAAGAALNSVYFGKNKVQDQKMEWSMIKTMHFDIYFKKDAEEFGKVAALMSENAYYYLKKSFKKPIKYRVPVIFYDSHTTFESTNIIYPLLSEGVGGFTEHEKNRVVIPFDGSYVKLEKVLIHELTHAYDKAMQASSRSSMYSVGNGSLPFWFSEGLPEHLSIGGNTVYNNMFIKDMIINDYLIPLEYVGGYYAYREGEAFLNFVREKYGSEAVMDFYYTVLTMNDMDAVCQKVFSLKFEDLQKQWRIHEKKRTLSLLNKFSLPFEQFEKRTDHKKTEASMNVAPRINPLGNKYAYFANRNLRTGIWESSVLGIKKDKKLITGEVDGKIEEFHFQRNNISWFPDGKHFAFVGKTSRGDYIYIFDSEKKKITDKIILPEFNNIYEIDVNHEGNKIALSGQINMATDIYVYDINRKQIQQLSNDRYDDSAPRWSPDDSKIAFTSERYLNSIPVDSLHVFYGMTDNIFYYDFADNNFYAVTTDDYRNFAPMWTADGKSILFVTERENIANYDIINIETGKRASVTKSLTGVMNGDLGNDDNLMVLSSFFDGGWDIYIYESPLDSLEYFEYKIPSKYVFQDDFNKQFNIDRYKFYGFKERKFKKGRPDYSNRNVTTISFRKNAESDSIAKEHNGRIDSKPDSISNPPFPEPYKLKFSLDRFWGGMGYSSSLGAVGYVQFSMSDLMGDHGLGVRAGINGEFKNSDLILNYIYRPHRIDFGFGIIHYYDEDNWNLYQDMGSYILKVGERRDSEKEFGVYSLISYPFNKFWRIDLENYLLKRKEKIEFMNFEYPYIPPKDVEVEDEIYMPQVRLVHDNVLYATTGPIQGWRGIALFNRNFSADYEHTTGFLDLRKYFFFAKKFALAGRVVGAASFGKNPQEFTIEGYEGIRGYTVPDNEDDDARFKAMASLELRYPFIEYLQLGFPLPVGLQNIRGSLFADVGSVWDEWDDFRGYKDSRLNDLILGFGFGPRLGLGFITLKLDIAWTSDFHKTTRPGYYFSLSPDF